ncbi:MAG: hypothetical protein UR11_C0003G0002 [Candidatus Woesebacteria bacterium GW2011_GWC1_30_29]|nr:MAG: hypothetical protein UR11_C0003G0002 [Candidatus Woesebacteria bacterium GW2011_GWC1_30_29]
MSQKKKKLERKIKKIEVNKAKIEFGDYELIDFLGVVKKHWIFLVILLIGTFILFANGLNANFVSDDYATIPQNPNILDLGVAFKIFNPVDISNSIIANIFGISPLPFHLYSLFLYFIFLIIAFVILESLFGEMVAKFSMVIFAVLPIHVEAVTWISGKPYLFIGITVLASFLAYINYLKTNNLKYLFYSLLFFLIGFLTDRPRPFSVFLVAGLYLLYMNRREYWDRTKKLLPLIVAMSVLFLVIAWPYISSRINVVNSGYNVSESVFYNPFFQYPTGLAKYFQIMFFPADLTLYHTMYIFPVWLNWAILLTYLGSIGYFYFKDKRYFFALSFMLVAILPSMAPVKVSWLVAERYAFLPSLGFCLFLGLIITDLGRKYKLVSLIILAVIVFLYGVRTYLRNIDWQTNHKLWVNTCQVSPNSHNAWNNIGDDYDKLEQYENSIKGFTQSTVVKPNYADAYHNRANIFFKIGRLDLARYSYETALSFSPGLYQTYLSLTQIDLMEKKMDLALKHAAMSVQLQQENPQSWYVLAVVQGQAGLINDAKTSVKNALILDPNYQAARDLLTSIEALIEE